MKISRWEIGPLQFVQDTGMYYTLYGRRSEVSAWGRERGGEGEERVVGEHEIRMMVSWKLVEVLRRAAGRVGSSTLSSR